MNTSRTNTLRQIRHESLTGGLLAALHTARTAFEDGRIDDFDISEVFLALRTGSWHSFDACSGLADCESDSGACAA